MTIASAGWGPRLAAYIETHLASDALTPNAWADRKPGISGADITRWRQGTEPSLPKLVVVADALGVSLLDVLTASGVIGADELGREPVTPAVPSVDASLTHDPSIHNDDRARLRDIVDAFRAVRSGQAAVVRRRGGHRKT